MVGIEENISLQHLNTFGIPARAKYFVEISSVESLKQLLQEPIYNNHRRLVLGEGSNVLFTRDFDGLIIKSAMKGISIVQEDDECVQLRASSGENWHMLVLHCLNNNWGGIENLSLIPGTVGAAPMQNIGAYGVDIQEVIENVSGIELETGLVRTFNRSECRFNYRESVFKRELREKYFISSITLRLSKKNHRINSHYGAIQDELKRQKVEHATIRDVSNAVIAIRRSKLPDPHEVGNAGSFFTNPTVSQDTLETIRHSHPSIPSYPTDSHRVKIPAGWLIEQCGWKGKRFGEIGVHPMHALVLVNYGSGNGEEIFRLATKISQSVEEKFGLTLTPEVNII